MILAIALAAAFWLCPSRAQASCADYVVVVNPSAEYLQNRAMEHAARPMHSSCPCQGPQCRASDSIPSMPPPAQITPESSVLLAGSGQPNSLTLLDNCLSGNWLIHSEAHLLSPDPPPRSHS